MIKNLMPLVVVPLFIIIAVAVYSQFTANLDRSDWSTDANDTYDDVNTATYGAFQLSSQLPYVVGAVTIIALFIGALYFKGA